MSKPFILCYSKKDFDKLCQSHGWTGEENFPQNTVFISITNHEACQDYLGEEFKESDFHLFPDSEHVLNVEFDDIAKDTETMEDGTIIRGMDDETADRIVAFIDKYAGHDIIVHCKAGKSRSQAVVTYVLDHYPELYKKSRINMMNPPVFYMVNLHAKHKLREAYERLNLSRTSG